MTEKLVGAVNEMEDLRVARKKTHILYDFLTVMFYRLTSRISRPAKSYGVAPKQITYL